MMRWVLPDYIQDALPEEAAQIETLRAQLLEAFRVRGYHFVMPPLLEHLDALLTGTGRDLGLRTFQLVDQLSGRALGIRADMTPQVARIDAHLLNRKGVSRLCYCASVLHTLPANFHATREPLQLGAEIYGHAGIEADIEILRLLADVMRLANIPASRIEVSHVGIFHALVQAADMDRPTQETLFGLLQNKDLPELSRVLADTSPVLRNAFMALPHLYGGRSVLAEAAQRLPQNEAIGFALSQLEALGEHLEDLPVNFDLSDLRGYHYHSGIVFAAYGANASTALAHGGRYDAVGKAFGRARPATGFSLDLRQWVHQLPMQALPGAILAPAVNDPMLNDLIDRLRQAGEIVMNALPGHDAADWLESGCDRKIEQQKSGWQVVPLVKKEL